MPENTHEIEISTATESAQTGASVPTQTADTQQTDTDTNTLDPASFPIRTIIQDPGKTAINNRIYKVVKGYDSDSKKRFEEIGNFYINCVAFGPNALTNEIEYLVLVNNEFHVYAPDFISTPLKLKNLVRPNVWQGDADDTEALAKIVFQDVRKLDHHNLVVVRDYVGRYTNDQIEFWLFEKHIIITKRLGEPTYQVAQIPPQRVLLIDDLYIVIEQENINKALVPKYQSQTLTADPKTTNVYDLDQFLADWLSQVKNQTLLYSLLGWFISTLYLERVNELRRSSFFPFFVITAATESGKTSLLANCIKIFGLNYIGENFAASVTRFVETVEFARVSHLPIWRDEYKNEKYALEKEGWLRSVYTRSSSSRGSQDQTVKQYPTNATLLLSGEDITEDPALARRMIKMRLKKDEKTDKQSYQDITRIASQKFPLVFPLLLKQGFNSEVFSEIFNAPENALPNDTDQQDELMCYASLGAIFGASVARSAIEASREYYATTATDITNTKQVTVDEFFSAIHSFFLEKGWLDSQFNNKPKALDYFYFPQTITTNYLSDGTVDPCGPTKKVYIKFPSLHSIVTKNRAIGEYKWSKRAIGQLITEAYGAKTEPRRYDNRNERVMIVENYDHYTDNFSDLVTNLEQIHKEWKEKTAAIDGLEPI